MSTGDEFCFFFLKNKFLSIRKNNHKSKNQKQIYMNLHGFRNKKTSKTRNRLNILIWICVPRSLTSLGPSQIVYPRLLPEKRGGTRPPRQWVHLKRNFWNFESEEKMILARFLSLRTWFWHFGIKIWKIFFNHQTQMTFWLTTFAPRLANLHLLLERAARGCTFFFKKQYYKNLTKTNNCQKTILKKHFEIWGYVSKSARTKKYSEDLSSGPRGPSAKWFLVWS